MAIVDSTSEEETLNEHEEQLEEINEGDDVRVYYYSNHRGGSMTQRTATVVQTSRPLTKPCVMFDGPDGKARIYFDTDKDEYEVVSQATKKPLGEFIMIVRTRTAESKPHVMFSE